MAEVEEKKKRSANFSTADCLLLAEIMGSEYGMEGLTFHAYTKHRFTNTITAVAKKLCWVSVTERFNNQAEFPRDQHTLNKKWDNLVQIHRYLFAEHLILLNKTGGGPKPAKLTILTEAVVDVVGRKSQTVTGIALSEDMDSSMLLIKQQIVFSPQQAGKESLGDTPGGSKSTIDVICCACKCHRKIEALKEEKLKLQIKYYKRKLCEE